MYIYECKDWPKFIWQEKIIMKMISEVRLEQGILLGKMFDLGFGFRDQVLLQVLTEDVVKSSEIEGEKLDLEQVRSSIAKRLGIDIEHSVYASHNVEGVVEMMLDATQKFRDPVTKERLFAWHLSLFPGGMSGFHKIIVGSYRNDLNGIMQIVSGAIGKEKVHYQAPAAGIIPEQMEKLIEYINVSDIDRILQAGIVHFWFLILHPFEDGNGRIARALTDYLLAKSEDSSLRFYSMSSQISKNRKSYYEILETSNKASLDITNWLVWFLGNLLQAIKTANVLTKQVLAKAGFWKDHQNTALSERQIKVITSVLDGFQGHLTTKKWAIICKCSHDTANRDIIDLIDKQILEKRGEGRATHYILR
jgi:Fic family protein